MKTKNNKFISKEKYENLCFELDFVATLSNDKRKVGCILVDSKNRNKIISGYNRSPALFYPMRDKNNDTMPYVLHAEEIALLKSNPTKTYDLLVTYAPCIKCASLIIASKRIRSVHYKKLLNENKSGLEMLQTCNIPIFKIGE